MSIFLQVQETLFNVPQGLEMISNVNTNLWLALRLDVGKLLEETTQYKQTTWLVMCHVHVKLDNYSMIRLIFFLNKAIWNQLYFLIFKM